MRRWQPLGLCVLFGSLWMPQAQALDILQAYEAALTNDPKFRSASKAYEAGLANRDIGRSALLPKLNANYTQLANNSSLWGSAYTNGQSANVRNSAYSGDTVNVQLTQPLFNLAALAQMRQGMAKGDQSEAQFISETQDLLARVLQTYTELLYAQDSLAYLTAERNAYKEQLSVNQRTFEKGEGTVTDMLETKASYQLAEAKVIEAQDAVELAKRNLEALIGERLKSAADVKGLGTNFRVVPLAPRAFELWQDKALANNPQLRSSDHGIEVARQEYQKQRAAHYPTVSAVVGWNQQRNPSPYNIGGTAVNSQAGVQINVPIFSGGETTGLTSQARSNFERAQAERDMTRDKVITELRKQYDLVNSSLQRVEALNRAVESSTELTRAMRKSVQGGQRINLDILLADKALATARRDLAQAKYSYMLAEIRIKQQAGTLSVEDFEKIARNFQLDKPVKH